MTSKTLLVKYVKSCIGYSQRQKRTLHALGLKRLGDQVEVSATDAVQGMLDKISHLVQITPDASSGKPDASSGKPDASSGNEPMDVLGSRPLEEE